MVVYLHKHHLAYFRRKARNSYPNEIAALLVGRTVGAMTEVHYFFYPVLDKSDNCSVELNVDSCLEAEEYANDQNLRIIGMIHSHPDCLPIMSSTDHNTHVRDGDVISGIVEVMNNRTRVVFWRADTSLSCEVKYF